MNALVCVSSFRLTVQGRFFISHPRKEEHLAEKQSNRERLQEITERIEQGVKDVFTSENTLTICVS